MTADSRFSFSFQYDGDAFVDFGTPQMDAMTSDADIVDVPMQDDFYWSQFMQGVAFGDTTANNSFSFAGELYTIFDTGTSAMLFSGDYFTSIVTKFYTEYVGT